MIVSRLSESLQDRNWTTLVLELFIVVLGVFLGLQAQAWYEERERRDLEGDYIVRLHDDVMGLQERRAQLIEFREGWNAGLQSVKPVLFDGVDRAITPNECRGMAFSYIVSNPTDDLGSLIELQSSGRLSLVRNERVSRAIQSFLLTRARARDSQAGVSRTQPALTTDFPDVFRVLAPTDPMADPAVPGIVECDAEGMRMDRAFLNAFEIAQANYGFHMRDNTAVSASLAELHEALEETLGIEHE